MVKMSGASHPGDHGLDLVRAACSDAECVASGGSLDCTAARKHLLVSFSGFNWQITASVDNCGSLCDIARLLLRTPMVSDRDVSARWLLHVRLPASLLLFRISFLMRNRLMRVNSIWLNRMKLM